MHFWVRFMRIGLIAIVAVVLQAGVVSEASLVPLDDSQIRDLRSGCYRYMIETASIGRGFVVSRPADEIQIHELRVPFARSPVPEKFKAAPIAKNGKYMVAAGEKSTLLTVNRGEHGGAIWEKSETGIAPVLQSMVPMNGMKFGWRFIRYYLRAFAPLDGERRDFRFVEIAARHMVYTNN